MFYSLRHVMDQDCNETGEFWVAMAVDPDAVPMNIADRRFGSADEAKSDYGMVTWAAPSEEASPEVVAEGWDE